MLKDWMDFTTSTTSLALESQRVIGMRLTKMAWGGTAAFSEAQLMVSEKAAAFEDAVATITRGGSSQAVVDAYLAKVRANHVRLRAE